MSTYNAHKQGRKDALHGKPPNTNHRSSFNQSMYDQGYAGGLVELQAREAAAAPRLRALAVATCQENLQTAIGHIQRLLEDVPPLNESAEEARDWLEALGH